jgi:hypothetical protein
MTLSKYKRAVGIFSSRIETERALRELRESGFPMNQVSVVAQDGDGDESIAGVDVKDETGSVTGEGARVGTIAGGFTGGLVGLVGALSALTIPGVGPIVVGGPVAAIIGDTLIGGVAGAAVGGLVGTLVGLGIPEDRARVYRDRLKEGNYLVIVEGTEQQMGRAGSILNLQGIQEWGLYDVPPANPPRAGYTTAPGTMTGSSIVDYGTPPRAMTGSPTVPPDVPTPTPKPAPPTPTELEQTSHNVPDRTALATRRAVGVFATYEATEEALQELRRAGFPMEQVSVVARDTREDVAGVELKESPQQDRPDIADEPAALGASSNQGEEGATVGLVAGGALGGITGLLVGVGALAIPGVGPILFAGAEATAIATTLAGGAVGAAAGGLLGGLIGLGIPEDRAKVYNDLVAAGEYLVMVRGTESDIRRAEAILSDRGIREWGIYEVPDEPMATPRVFP